MTVAVDDPIAVLPLAGNGVTNLRGLNALRKLRRLDLRGNPITDLRPLANLESLIWVHVGGCDISDFTTIEGRTDLTVCQRRSENARQWPV